MFEDLEVLLLLEDASGVAYGYHFRNEPILGIRVEPLSELLSLLLRLYNMC